MCFCSANQRSHVSANPTLRPLVGTYTVHSCRPLHDRDSARGAARPGLEREINIDGHCPAHGDPLTIQNRGLIFLPRDEIKGIFVDGIQAGQTQEAQVSNVAVGISRYHCRQRSCRLSNATRCIGQYLLVGTGEWISIQPCAF